MLQGFCRPGPELHTHRNLTGKRVNYVELRVEDACKLWMRQTIVDVHVEDIWVSVISLLEQVYSDVFGFCRHKVSNIEEGMAFRNDLDSNMSPWASGYEFFSFKLTFVGVIAEYEWSR